MKFFIRIRIPINEAKKIRIRPDPTVSGFGTQVKTHDCCWSLNCFRLRECARWTRTGRTRTSSRRRGGESSPPYRPSSCTSTCPPFSAPTSRPTPATSRTSIPASRTSSRARHSGENTRLFSTGLQNLRILYYSNAYKIWRPILCAYVPLSCSYIFVLQRLLCFELWSVADPVLDPDLKLFTVLNPELNPLWLMTIPDPKFSMRIRPLGWKMH